MLFSHSVVYDYLQSHGQQHARLPCPSLSLGVCSTNVHQIDDVIQHPILCFPFSCPQSFPPSGSFPMSWLFSRGCQSIGVSASVSVLSEYSGLISFRIDCFDLFAVQGTLKSCPQHHSSKASLLQCQAFFMV